MIVNTSPLEKLKIIAYEDPEYSKPVGKEYEAFVNPEEYMESFKVEYNQKQGEGTSGTVLRFKSIPPSEITLNLIFDNTGALAHKSGATDLFSRPEPKSLDEQIEEFKDIVRGYDGDIHNAYYLKVLWGVIIFHGKLNKLDIRYSVFKPDGRPMRAHAKATFTEFKDDKKRTSEEGKNSPDLTHIRTVSAGDTLPLMTHRIYGDFSYYLEVARVNQLKNYRNLIPGTKLFFPPIDKNTA